MYLKTLIITLLFFNCSFASFQEVRIGKIDDYYKNKISKYELRNIIDDVEYRLESQLNTNVFDYSENGKAIDIIYVPASKLEKRITKLVQKIKIKQEKIKKLQLYFPKKEKDIEIIRDEFERKNSLHSKKIKDFNNYVKDINQKKRLSSSEYKKVKKYVEEEKLKLNKQTKALKSERRVYQKEINRFNHKLNTYNNEIRQFNSLNNELERLNRSFKKVKGMTFGQKEIRVKTFYKDGKKIQEKKVNSNMNKIEIYGFEDLNELKTIIAHEILHLVGIPHINKKGSLMHPVLQKQQLDNINLTNEDIINFRENF